MKRPWMFVSLVFVGCQFQASCGGKKLDMDNARTFVASALASDVGAPPDKVTCPDEVAIAKDATFECTAHYGSAAAKVVIRQNDDQGNVTVSSVSGITVSKHAEAAIAKGIGESANVHVTVDCGPRVRPAKAGETFTCTAMDAKGAQGQVTVSVKDAEGNVSWKLEPAGAGQQ